MKFQSRHLQVSQVYEVREITLLSVMRECNDIAGILFNWM